MNTRKMLLKLSKQFPKKYAKMNHDRVGLMMGKLPEEVRKILLCLDLDHEILALVKQEKPDLILTHHPFIYGTRAFVLSHDPVKKALYDEFVVFSSSLYLIGDPDDLRANCNNAYIYFAIVGDITKVVFIPTDHDRAFGSCGDGGNPTGNFTLTESPFSSHLGYGQDGASDLFNKMIVSSNSTEIV